MDTDENLLYIVSQSNHTYDVEQRCIRFTEEIKNFVNHSPDAQQGFMAKLTPEKLMEAICFNQ